MSHIRMAGSSHTGARSHNEDVVRHGSTPQAHFAVLADGAGGHRRGAEAAHRSADCMERLLRDGGLDFCPASLTTMVRQAHRVLLAHQDASASELRMHSTVVTLWIDAAGEHAGKAYRIVRQELDAYGAGLSDKPEIIALSKCDVVDEEMLKQQMERLRRAVSSYGPTVAPGEKRRAILKVSAATGAGVREALRALLSVVEGRRKQEAEAEPQPEWRP